MEPRPDPGLRPAQPSVEAAPADVIGSDEVSAAPVSPPPPQASAPLEPAPPERVAMTNGHATDGERLVIGQNGGSNGHQDLSNGGLNGRDDRANGVTAPQLRRFIKSRPYVPMHELRRRFAIDGNDDEVTRVELAESNVYVGLPEREGSLLGELLRGGEVGYELSFDPRAPVVVGVYPMRPVPRA